MRVKMPRREFLKVAGTTALAVSVTALTGCGGSSGGGSTGGNGSNRGNDTPDNGNGGTGDNGNGDNSGSDDSGSTKPGKISYKDTRTAKYFADKGVTAANFYMEGNVTGSWSGKVLVAKSGENVRYRKSFSNGTAKTGWNVLVLGETAYVLNDKKQQYQLYADYIPDTQDEKTIKSGALRLKYGEGYFVIPADNGDILQIKETTCVVNGVTYDAEQMFIAIEKSGSGYNGYAVNYCFDGDKLVYIVSGGYTTTITQLYPNPKASLLKLPEGYTQVPRGTSIESDWEF